MEAGIGDPVNTIKAIRDLAQKLGTNVKDHRRQSPGSSGSSQMTRKEL